MDEIKNRMSGNWQADWQAESIVEYFNKIGKVKLLSHEEEVDIGRSVREEEWQIHEFLSTSGMAFSNIIPVDKKATPDEIFVLKESGDDGNSGPTMDRDRQRQVVQQLKYYATLVQNKRTEIERCEQLTGMKATQLRSHIRKAKRTGKRHWPHRLNLLTLEELDSRIQRDQRMGNHIRECKIRPKKPGKQTKT